MKIIKLLVVVALLLGGIYAAYLAPGLLERRSLGILQTTHAELGAYMKLLGQPTGTYDDYKKFNADNPESIFKLEEKKGQRTYYYWSKESYPNYWVLLAVKQKETVPEEVKIEVQQ